MKEYLKQRLSDLRKEYRKLNNKNTKGVCNGAINSVLLNQTKGAILETEKHLNYLNAQAESQNINNNESQKERLIDFVKWFNTDNDAPYPPSFNDVENYLKSIKCD